MTIKIKNVEFDLEKIDAFNEFMVEKGAFVMVGDQVVQNPKYPYGYDSLYAEFKKKY